MGNDITVIQNRTHTFQATLTSGGSTWDISSATEIYFTVKQNIADTSNKFQLTKTGGGITAATDYTDGVINIAIDNSNTATLSGSYIYAIDVTLGGETYQCIHDSFIVDIPVYTS